MNLFKIDGVTEQRENPCDKCPDGKTELPPEVLARVVIKAHRCHETPGALCGGRYRPRGRSEVHPRETPGPSSKTISLESL
jgi:hypothetical protein